jgi:hypothetical protein
VNSRKDIYCGFYAISLRLCTWVRLYINEYNVELILLRRVADRSFDSASEALCRPGARMDK